MRLYQRDIYEWNKNNEALKMSSIEVAYKISPFMNYNLTTKNYTMMKHFSEDSI